MLSLSLLFFCFIALMFAGDPQYEAELDGLRTSGNADINALQGLWIFFMKYSNE